MLCKRMEKLSTTRYTELVEFGRPHTVKVKSAIIRDNMIAHLVKRHQEGTLTDQQYFNEVVEVQKDYDLPGEAQRRILNL